MTIIGLIKIEPSERSEELLRLLEPLSAAEESADADSSQAVSADLERLREDLRQELGQFRSRIADPVVRRATL